LRAVIPDYDRESKTVDPRVKPEDDRKTKPEDDKQTVIPDSDRESKTLDPRVIEMHTFRCKPEDDIQTVIPDLHPKGIYCGNRVCLSFPTTIGNLKPWIPGVLKCIPLGESPRMTNKLSFPTPIGNLQRMTNINKE